MPFITCTFFNTWSDSSGLWAGCWAFTIATTIRHAKSAATATVVLVDPRLMLSPARTSVAGKAKGRDGAARDADRNGRPRLLGGRCRLAEVRGAVDLLARIGHRDLRALREVHVRVAALHDAADERDGHARLHGRGAPAELLDQLLRPGELRGPARVLSTVVHVEDDQRVRIDHDELHDRALQGDGLFVVATCITVVRPGGTGNQACDGQRDRAENGLLHGNDTSFEKARKRRPSTVSSC